MRYQPEHNVSCHTGREGDAESLDGLLRGLARVLDNKTALTNSLLWSLG